jgi:enterochelin esterase-like enzyme
MPFISRLGRLAFGFLVCGSVGFSAHAQNDYKLAPESTERAPGVPMGRVEKFQFTESKVFADTARDCWIYIPAQYDGSKPAALMVFQDGGGYVGETGGQRAPIVFDNLIAKGEMPVTIAVFINPGTRVATDSSATPTPSF